MSMIYLLTPAGIKPVIYRFVAQPLTTVLQRSLSHLYVPLCNNFHLLLLLVEVQCVFCEVRVIFLCITVSTDFRLQAAVV